MHLSRRAALAGLAALAVAPVRAAAQALAVSAVATPNDSAGTMLYAADLGFYAKAGLDVKMTVLNNPGPTIAAVASGATMVGGGPTSQIAIARERGIPISFFAPLSLYLSAVPTNALIVLRGSPLRRAADLAGKTVSTRDLNNMSYFGARAWIDKNGGDSKSVKWVEIPDTGSLAALQSGRIDAASVSEPALDDFLRGGEVRVVGPVFDAIAPRFLVGGCFAADATIKANPDAIRKFASAIVAASRWANQPQNRAQSGAILGKYANATVRADSTRSVYAEDLRIADIQPVLDLLVTYGVLKAPMKAADLIAPLA